MNIYDQYISTKLQTYMLEKDAKREKDKTSFWATDSEKPLFDLYHAWIGTEPTNPIDAEKLVVFSSGKMMEVALIENLTAMGLVKKFESDEQQYIRIEREGVMVSGYVDGIFVDGTPLEVKTFYGDYMSRELKDNKPKTSYLKQLAIYMDALNQDKGKLIFMDRGTGEMYEFTLLREPGTLKFKCMTIEFDLSETYKRWGKFYRENVVPKIEPSPFECGFYKADIRQIDWKKVSKSDISKARTGSKVIGSNPKEHWKILYSPFKSLLIEKQGSQIGYTDAEVQEIRTITKGYSSTKFIS